VTAAVASNPTANMTHSAGVRSQGLRIKIST